MNDPYNSILVTIDAIRPYTISVTTGLIIIIKSQEWSLNVSGQETGESNLSPVSANATSQLSPVKFQVFESNIRSQAEI